MDRQPYSLSAAEALSCLADWQCDLRLTHLAGSLAEVDPMQVTGEDGLPGAELVGVISYTGRFVIAHTRDLTEHDIIHELLHVAFPDWEHIAVERWTDRLYRQPALVGRLLEPPIKHRRDNPMAEEFKAYNLRTRREVTIKDPKVVTMKNGRKAVQGIASDDGKTKVFRILGKAEESKLT